MESICRERICTVNMQGKECRIRKIWCNKHHFNDHYIFFVKRDYHKKDKAMIPYVLYSAICHRCYDEDFNLKRNQIIALGQKFDENRYAYDGIIQRASENDFQALWSTRFY